MLRQLLLLGVICASAFAMSDDLCCTIEDRQEVIWMWGEIWSAEHSDRMRAVVETSFSRFFDKHPEARPLFATKGVDDLSSVEFRSHALRVAAGLGTLINLAMDSATFETQLEWLGEFHAKIDGMKPEYFLPFLETFAEVMPEAIPCFNTGAWTRCMHSISDALGAQMSAARE